MGKLIYPRDLYATLRRRWSEVPHLRVELPEKAVLDQLLDVCYHASLMTEEGRPIVFRVAFISSKTPVSPEREHPIDLDAPFRAMVQTDRRFHPSDLRVVAGGEESARPERPLDL